MNQSDLARLCGVSQPHFSRMYRWYKQGINATHIPNDNPLGKSKPVRLHALALKWDTSSRIDTSLLPASSYITITDWEAGQGWKKLELEGHRARLTPTSLTVWLPKPMNLSIGGLQQGEEEAIASLFAIRDIVQQRLNLPLYQEAEIIEEHIAFVDDPGAIDAVNDNRKVIIRDIKDGKARFIVDQSTGVPEAEFVHNKHAGKDSKRYDRMVMQVIEQDEWERIHQRQEHTETMLERYLEQINLHVEVLQKLKTELDSRPAKKPSLWSRIFKR